MDPQNFLVRWVRYWLVTELSSEIWNRGSGNYDCDLVNFYIYPLGFSKFWLITFIETLILISLLPQKTNLINYFLHFQLSFKSLSAQISIHPQAAALAIQLEKIENGALFPIDNRRRIGGIAGQGQIGKGIERNSNVWSGSPYGSSSAALRRGLSSHCRVRSLSLATLFDCYQVDSFLFDKISSSSNSLQTMLVIGVGVWNFLCRSEGKFGFWYLCQFFLEDVAFCKRADLIAFSYVGPTNCYCILQS